MVTKQLYTAPEAEIIVTWFEGNILSEPGSGYNLSGSAGNDLEEKDDYTYSF